VQNDELKINKVLQKHEKNCIIGGEKVPDKLLELKNDLVFQELFGNPKNSQITGHLLSLILKREVYKVDLDVNKRMLRNSPDLKVGRLDIRAKFNDGEDCNIELQVEQYENMENRMLEYWAMMYGNKIHRGQKYDVLKPSISILIADYNLEKTKNISRYHTKWNLREEKQQDMKLTNDIEMHILEIPKIKDTELEKDELAQWLKFIDNPESGEVKRLMSENKFWKQAMEELEYLSGEPDFQRLVESRYGFLVDQEVKGEERERKGKKETQTKIAKKMKNKNMPIEEIVELTGLTKEEVEKL
jgi:predicted transposase/invertase (TIGR01784 family)